MKRFDLIFVAGLGAALLLAASAGADDKQILQSASGPPQVVIVLDNSGMATYGTTFLGSPANLAGSSGGYGGADTPDAKMEAAKLVLLQFLNPPPNSSQWGVATFSRGTGNNQATNFTISSKEFIYEQVGDGVPGHCDFSTD